MTIAVVGAGPTGLIISALLSARGEEVTLVDEWLEPGGHLAQDKYQVGSDTAESDAWLAELRIVVDASSTIPMLPAIAWAAFRSDAGYELAINLAGAERPLCADHLVLATGTTDVPLISPGATLPGVMTSRAIRLLLYRHGVIPGQRIAMVGSGPATDRLRSDLASIGCDVVCEVAEPDVEEIAGEDGVRALHLTDGRALDVDIVVVALGEVPDLQLAGMVDTPRVYDPLMGGWRVAADGTPAGLHVAGGARYGPTTPEEIVQSAVDVADRICPGGPGLQDIGLDISDAILRWGAVRR